MAYAQRLIATRRGVVFLSVLAAIPKGTSGTVIASAGLYSATTIRQSQLLNGAYSDASSLRDRVATRDIYPGSQLTTGDFAAATTNLAASLTNFQRIVTILFFNKHGST